MRKKLIASNTNQAVVKCFETLWELGRDHPASEWKNNQKGKNRSSKLEDEWGELIDIDSITEVKGKDLKEKFRFGNSNFKLNQKSTNLKKY